MTIESLVNENLAKVRNKLAAAARRSGRSESAVTLVAVTKTVGVEVAKLLIEVGCCDLGENRPQELWSKAEAFRTTVPESAVRWHMIGHLQRNKVRRTLPLVSLCHSVDSMRLFEEIDREAQAALRRARVLIEVNISGDRTKHGFAPDEVEPRLIEMANFEHAAATGLMCMASREGDDQQARQEFAALRALRDRLQQVAPPNIRLSELSMGMSGDYEIAVEEGATLVRIGSALFEGISAGG